MSEPQARPRRRGPGPLTLLIIIGVVIVAGVAVYAALTPGAAHTDSVTVGDTAMETTMPKGLTRQFVIHATYFRGEIVWLDDPKGGAALPQVRRIVAVAGDTLQLQRGSLIVNGTTEKEDYVSSTTGVADFGPVTVPNGAVFLLGDNRATAQDSRQWGAIPLTAIRGTLAQ